MSHYLQHPKFLLALTAVAAFSLAYPASVQAVPTTYQYTGNPFTNVSGPYTTSMFVAAMVTLAGPLVPNMPLTQVFPTAFSLFDGVQTITNLNANFFVIQFQTGPTGAITAWNMAALVASGSIGSSTALGGLDLGHRVGPGIGFNGVTPLSPGTWALVGSVPDTGSTLSLMTLTLMALGLVARRFQRAAA